MIAAAGRLVMLRPLFVGEGTVRPAAERRNGLNIVPGSSGPGGHNNIKMNPVLRGMVRWQDLTG
jgi:hypothetical protein